MIKLVYNNPVFSLQPFVCTECFATIDLKLKEVILDHKHEIRWHQRLQHFQQTLSQLDEATELFHQRVLSRIETQGLIKAFEFTYELAWNVIKDYFYYQGNTSITGSRDAIREAFQQGLITDDETWMEMIKSRNQTPHTYNEEIATEITHKIVDQYVTLFTHFKNKMEKIKNNG